MANEPAEALKAFIEDLFFLGVQHVLGVKDGGGMELLCLLEGVLLQVLEGEDVLDCLIKVNVVNFGII